MYLDREKIRKFFTSKFQLCLSYSFKPSLASETVELVVLVLSFIVLIVSILAHVISPISDLLAITVPL